MEFIVFSVSGGIGKNVIATSVARAINEQYPDRKIIILTAHPDIWINNPRIFKVIQFGQTAYFYDDYIKDKNTLIFTHDPYGSTDAIYRTKPLSQVWCELCGVEWKGEKPELYFTELERDQLFHTINKTGPILLIQPFGGAQTHHKYSWMRDIPPVLAQRIVDEFKNDYRIIQIKREDQLLLNGAEFLTANPRNLALALMLSDKRIFIDSFMQHAAAALGLPSSVFWIGNSSLTFGYNIHQNIVTSFEVGSTRNSLFDPFDIQGDPIQLATPPSSLFNTESVISALKGAQGPQLSNNSAVDPAIIPTPKSIISKAPSIQVPHIPDITELIPGIEVKGLVPLDSNGNVIEEKTVAKSKKK
jgi:hypothetical protein